MEHLKNIGMGAAAFAIVLFILAGMVVLGAFLLTLLDWLALHYPNAGARVFWGLVALAILWATGRTFRRRAS